MKSEKGFSLIELLIVVTLIAIIAAIAMMGSEFSKGRQLTAASKQLYADLQKIRIDAMTRGTAGRSSRGFGIRFNSNIQYTIFEFQDDPNPLLVVATDNNYKDDGGAEEVLVRQTTMPSGTTVTVDNATDPTNDVRIYDKIGMIRTTAWQQTGRTYVVRLAGVTQARCVTLATARIREGVWDGAICNTQ